MKGDNCERFEITQLLFVDDTALLDDSGEKLLLLLNPVMSGQVGPFLIFLLSIPIIIVYLEFVYSQNKNNHYC